MSLFLCLFYFVIINLAVAGVGYRLMKAGNRWSSWLLMVLAILPVCLLFFQQPPIIKMLAIIATTFTGMKAVAVTAYYKDKKASLNFIQWLAFVIGWAGMLPQPFEKFPAPSLTGGWPMIWFGVSRIIGGLAFVLLAHRLVLLPVNQRVPDVFISAILLVALSLILHFGLLSVGAGMWRFSGVNTYYLFRKPANATSLTGFWSKRWNLAFSEMTSLTIFRPLRDKLGAPLALMASFIFSGLLHELALSVPVNSGYGLPTLYFIIQGAMVLIEKKLIEQKSWVLSNKIFCKLWVFFWLIAPMPLLFHSQFIKQVVWPLAGLGHFNG